MKKRKVKIYKEGRKAVKPVITRHVKQEVEPMSEKLKPCPLREILFRGKRVDNGTWAYGDLSYWDDEMEIDSESHGENGGFIIPETVGQYTGLTDKNGKKIFEHDILKAYDPLDKRYFIGVVKYFDASFYICDTKSVPCYFGEYCFTDFEVEVIGNIFDNSLEELQNGN